MTDDEFQLPVIQTDLVGEEASACSPKIYVSNEEAALLQTMRSLREKALKMKAELGDAVGDRRQEIEQTLAEARAEWNQLKTLREKAYVRKMISLGHLPPEAEPG